MHIHRLERIWLALGTGTLIAFLIIVGVQAFAMGILPPGGGHRIDPKLVRQTPPFDKPGLTQIADNEYELVMVAYAFGFDPQGEIRIPRGAKVHFTVTTADVVHGFQIPGTTVNMMLEPGHVTHTTYTFDRPGKYLILCNEYCGAAHHNMAATLIVE